MTALTIEGVENGRRAFRALKAYFGDLIGRPIRLARVLDEHDALCVPLVEPKRTAYALSVVKWHEWGSYPRAPMCRPGELAGWGDVGGCYAGLSRLVPALKEIGRIRSTAVEVDIQDVTAIWASKSPLEKYDCLHAFVQSRSPDLIAEVSERQLERNLNHEGRIQDHALIKHHLVRYAWDGRITLANSGGSHHFAAARLLASRLGRSVPLRGRLDEHELNRPAIDALRADFCILAVSEKDIHAWLKFHEAMAAFRAAYFWKPLPRPYHDLRAIFLPRDEARSAIAADVMREAGAFDLGQHLYELAARQSNNRSVAKSIHWPSP